MVSTYSKTCVIEIVHTVTGLTVSKDNVENVTKPVNLVLVKVKEDVMTVQMTDGTTKDTVS
jgi:hypothetical protein